jgi:outer membrane protein OmpA-like peptidoglycan-associated protein
MSEERKVANARWAAARIIEALSPEDQVAVAGFDSRYWGLVAFSRDRQAVRRAVESIEPFGSTALHDALDKAARDIASHGEGRRAIVVLTDGVDTASQKKPDEVIARSRALDVPIYAVSVVSPLDDPASDFFLGKKSAGDAAAGTATLARYAELSGGVAYLVSSPAALKLAADRIAGELKHQYRRGAIDPQGGHRAYPQRLPAAVIAVPRRPGRRSSPAVSQGGHRVRTLIVPLLAASVTLAGCAKKSYVQREVGEINKKVEAVSAEVERTQQRVQQNEVRIDAVDKSAQAGISEAKGSAQAAMTRANEAEKAAKGKLIYTVTLSNDKVRFPVNRAEISDEAKAMIDEAVAPLVKENRGVWFEIEGHTDSTGEAAYNLKLGEERARAVRDYIAKAHGIALNRLNVISYGEDKPAAENKERDGRAQNRRVVIRILE